MKRIAIALVFAVLAACELEPAPKPTPAVVAQPGPGSGSGTGTGTGSAPIEVSDACVQAGVHIADAGIRSAKDDAQKHLYEQVKTQTVRRTAEACTNQHWGQAAIDCYTAAMTTDDVNACQKLLPGKS